MPSHFENDSTTYSHMGIPEAVSYITYMLDKRPLQVLKYREAMLGHPIYVIY